MRLKEPLIALPFEQLQLKQRHPTEVDLDAVDGESG
jgi:hypothetical protein